MRENRRGSQSGRIFPRPKARVGPPVIYTPPEFGISYRLFYFLLRRFVFPDFSSQPSGYFSWSCKLSSSWPPFFLPTLLFLSLPFPCAHLPLCTACRAHVPERQVCSQLFATRWISTRKRSNFKRRRARSLARGNTIFPCLRYFPTTPPSTINHTEWNGTRDRKKETKIPPIFLSHAKGTTISSSISESKGKEKKKKREGNIVDSFDQFARRFEPIAAHVS